MRFIRRRWLPLLAAVLVIGGPLLWYLGATPATTKAGTSEVVARVKQGDFRVVVTTTGELRARKFVTITGPANAQQAEVYQMRIASIVPEGTAVKEGDMVAELDRGAVATKLQEFTLALQKAEAQYTQAELDSTLNLSKAREDIRTMEFALEEKRLAEEQAKFEAPTIRRQAAIDLEKAQRALEQARVDYRTKTAQAIAKMQEVGADLERQRNKVRLAQNVMEGFTIRAPAEGMVIYVREWNGRKKGVGSQINPWEPTVATLPDLLQMESVTYVNEIDVRRLAVGQPVVMGLDAEPGKQLTGKVTSVANVGEQRPNADAKVFEVKISIEQADTTLRPGMTTSNAVETASIPDALSIPLEAVTYEGTTPYVYKRDGARTVRQQIETGTMNDNEVIVLRGLDADDVVLLVPPPDLGRLTTVPLPDAPPGATPPPTVPSDAPVVPVLPADSGRAPAGRSAATPAAAAPIATAASAPAPRTP